MAATHRDVLRTEQVALEAVQPQGWVGRFRQSMEGSPRRGVCVGDVRMLISGCQGTKEEGQRRQEEWDPQDPVLLLQTSKEGGSA